MTTYGNETQTCSNCGVSVECTILNSTNTFGSPDLDLRPSEMQRSTMHNWLQECSECGYVSGDLTTSTEDAKQIVESDTYSALRAKSELPELARQFERYSLLQHADPETAAVGLIRAAWACDDADNANQGKAYRNQAADILLTLQPCPDDEENTTLAAVLVDVLRRAERFDESKELATSLQSFNAVKANEIVSSVLTYQCKLCDGRDTGCHTIADCEKTG